MKFSVISLTLLATTLASGCATPSDISGLPKEPHPFLQSIGEGVVETILDLAVHDDVKDRCGTGCKREKHKIDSKKALLDEIEDRKRAEAMNQAFDQRHSTTDTADMIERQRSRNDWIADSEKKQRSVVMVDNPNQFD